MRVFEAGRRGERERDGGVGSSRSDVGGGGGDGGGGGGGTRCTT